MIKNDAVCTFVCSLIGCFSRETGCCVLYLVRFVVPGYGVTQHFFSLACAQYRQASSTGLAAHQSLTRAALSRARSLQIEGRLHPQAQPAENG